MLHDAFLVGVIALNLYFLATALSNIVYFRRATRSPRLKSGPFVSVVVPARNEEINIGSCVRSLLNQDYEDYEVIVVDDQSEDATAEIVRGYLADNPRLRLISGEPLPEGWIGKQHALSQATAVARGEILMFTDADTIHTPQSVSWIVTNLEDHHADLISGYLSQIYGSFGERLIVPTMYAMMLLVPLALVPHRNSKHLAFAIGQLVAVRRRAFDGIDGFETFKNSIVDDMSMAIRLKEQGYKGVFLDARQAASCRLYRGYRDAFHGIMRSNYSGVGGSPGTVIAMSFVVVGLIAGPTLSVLWSLLSFTVPSALVGLAAAIFAVQWSLTARDRDVPLTAVLLYPIVFLNLVVLLLASMVTTGFGAGVDWKGRLVRVPRAEAPQEPEIDVEYGHTPIA